MKPIRIVSLVIGSLLALLGFGLLAGGGILGWVLSTQRDDAGFVTSSTQRITTDSYALTSGKVDLGDPGVNRFGDWGNATVRVTVDTVQTGEVFVGIGSNADVEAYLEGVEHDAITSTDEWGGSRVRYQRQNVDGTSTPAPPASQSFWVAQASGAGSRDIVWPITSGKWEVVVMNADGSRNVTADVKVGGKADHLVAISIGLGVGGVVLLVIGAGLIVAGVVRPHSRDLAVGDQAAPGAPAFAPPTAALETVEAYPLRFEGHLDPNLSRWQWLVKWFLAIPHFIILVLLWVAFVVLTFVAFFAILFTGRYPRSIFDFNVGVLRWSWRVSYYATSALGTDRYPPFTLSPADYPASLDVVYPEHLSRGLVLVKSWLLAIPHLLIVGTLTSSWGFSGDGAGLFTSGGLLGVLVLVAVIALLFTGRYPARLHDLVVGINRWSYRVVIYVALMTDTYPPFQLDQGSSDPVE